MKVTFYNVEVDIDSLKKEFKGYIEKGLTVKEAIEKFNVKHYLSDNLEVYHSLVGTVNLRYVHNIDSITDDQEIESIKKDVKLKNLYNRKRECDKQISDLTIEMIKINDEINKEEKDEAQDTNR